MVIMRSLHHCSLLVIQWGSSPGVKLTVWVWVPQIIEYLCLYHSKIPR